MLELEPKRRPPAPAKKRTRFRTEGFTSLPKIPTTSRNLGKIKEMASLLNGQSGDREEGNSIKAKMLKKVKTVHRNFMRDAEHTIAQPQGDQEEIKQILNLRQNSRTDKKVLGHLFSNENKFADHDRKIYKLISEHKELIKLSTIQRAILEEKSTSPSNPLLHSRILIEPSSSAARGLDGLKKAPQKSKATLARNNHFEKSSRADQKHQSSRDVVGGSVLSTYTNGGHKVNKDMERIHDSIAEEFKTLDIEIEENRKDRKNLGSIG